MKLFQRYKQSASFGVIYSPNSNIIYDGNRCYCSILESVAIYDLKLGTCVDRLQEGTHNVTAMALHNRLLACGYANGTVRVWNLDTKTCTVFNGHRAPVSCLAFDAIGSRLASGSNDTDIVLWDIVAEAGLFRFKGHKDQVTCLKFLSGLNHLISGSKDTLIKVWDLTAQICVENVVSQRGEVWALDCVVDGEDITLFTGTADGQVRVWSLDPSVLQSKFEQQTTDSENPEIQKSIQLLGTLNRQGKDRVFTIKVHPDGEYIGVQGQEKMVEIFKRKTAQELKKTISRRKKRAKNNEEIELTIADKIPSYETIRFKAKVRSFDFSGVKIVAGLSNNSIEVFELTDDENKHRQLVTLDIAGHRSDVRSIALSSDDEFLASGSGDSIKIWNLRTNNCINTMDSGYVLCSAFLPGNKHFIVGTKTGDLELYELSSSSLLESVKAHDGPIWSLCLKPDKTGFVTGSQDKQVKFWEFRSVLDESYSKITKRLTLHHARTLKLSDDVMCVRISPDNRLLAVALLDLTVKVFYMDSLNFFLSLYGHKLPVISMDISFDSKIIITASSDKSVKIWGLDFGDCHKSLLAHQDAVMACQFVWGTYYFFTAGKDKMLKWWDAEKFEEIARLEGHQAEVWALAVGKYGNIVVTASHDKSIRVWEKTDDQFALQEEREEQLEKMYEDMEIQQDEQFADAIGAGVDGEKESQPVGNATKQTAESMKAGDLLLESILVWEKERVDFDKYEEMLSQNKEIARPPRDALVYKYGGTDQTPEEFVLHVVKSIRPSHLNDALLALPFSQVCSLFMCLRTWATTGTHIHLISRILTYLLQTHSAEIINTKHLQEPLEKIQTKLTDHIKAYRDTIGFNNSALQYLRRELDFQEVGFDDQPVEEEPKRKRVVVVSK
ncbi:WD40-repeat-containing domain protein [Gorgonomyces haynaldii]|nr:WD40-repeat-containing domain protein [Gorgonomyces haynaldii]